MPFTNCALSSASVECYPVVNPEEICCTKPKPKIWDYLFLSTFPSFLPHIYLPNICMLASLTTCSMSCGSMLPLRARKHFSEIDCLIGSIQLR